MSQLKALLNSDLKIAMKAKDTFKRETIRFLMSAIKQVEVDERKDLTDDDIVKLIQKSIKQREDAASQYKDAGREDLYEKEIAEAEILKVYMPKQLDDSELESIIKEIIIQSGANGMKDMGNVMKATLDKVGSSADGKRVSALVKILLN